MTKEEKINYWRSIVDQQTKSGQPATVFCREHTHSIHRFRWWKRRFKKEQSKTDKTGFIELVPRKASQKSGIQIHLGDQICLEVEQGFDPHTLLNVVETLCRKQRSLCSH